MHRREFIQHSVTYSLGGIALGIPSFSSAPKVRVVVVGCGGRGSDLIRSLSTIERAEVVGVCDDYAPHLARGISLAGVPAKGFTSYQKMLNQLKPEAVVIATPLFLHYDMALTAIEQGSAVFCEKTMCHTIEQAKDLAKTVQEKGVVFQVGLQRRANAIYRQAKAMIDTHMLGQITAIKAQWHRNGDWRRPVPVSSTHKDWKSLENRLNWRLYWPYSQGLMTELGSHQVDVANWFLGETPKRVIASGGTDFWRDGREVFDNVFGIYEYKLSSKQGEDPYFLRLTYSSLQNNAYEGASELIMGTKGSLFLSQKKGLFFQEQGAIDPGWGSQPDADIITSGKTLKIENDPWAHRGKPFEIDASGDDTRDELIAFLDNVQRKDPQTICTAEEGYRNTLSVISANRSIKENQAINIHGSA